MVAEQHRWRPRPVVRQVARRRRHAVAEHGGDAAEGVEPEGDRARGSSTWFSAHARITAPWRS